MIRLWKTTIVLWTKDEPSEANFGSCLYELVLEVEDNRGTKGVIARSGYELVEDPTGDPDLSDEAGEYLEALAQYERDKNDLSYIWLDDTEYNFGTELSICHEAYDAARADPRENGRIALINRFGDYWWADDHGNKIEWEE